MWPTKIVTYSSRQSLCRVPNKIYLTNMIYQRHISRVMFAECNLRQKQDVVYFFFGFNPLFVILDNDDISSSGTKGGTYPLDAPHFMSPLFPALCGGIDRLHILFLFPTFLLWQQKPPIEPELDGTCCLNIMKTLYFQLDFFLKHASQ
jgi:hypothetical protein